MQAQVFWHGDIEDTLSDIVAWRRSRATHLAISSADAGLKTVDDHPAALKSIADRIGLRVKSTPIPD